MAMYGIRASFYIQFLERSVKLPALAVLVEGRSKSGTERIYRGCAWGQQMPKCTK